MKPRHLPNVQQQPALKARSCCCPSTATPRPMALRQPVLTWHQESFYFAKLLAGGMQSIGARLRGRGGVRYIYYLENDQKQLVENTYTQVRPERSFTLLEDVDCPAVLAEQCFVTNDEDVEHFGSEQGCKTVARIYYEAICTYFGTEPLPVK